MEDHDRAEGHSVAHVLPWRASWSLVEATADPPAIVLRPASRRLAQMTRIVRLRRWQKTALDQFVASAKPDFLAVATPGAGKTTFALTAARHELGERPARLVVVAPTAHLKHQWAHAAARFSLHLDPSWSPSDGALPADMHGIVTSYQQVATSPGHFARVADGAFVVLDELHHAGEE